MTLPSQRVMSSDLLKVASELCCNSDSDTSSNWETSESKLSTGLSDVNHDVWLERSGLEEAELIFVLPDSEEVRDRHGDDTTGGLPLSVVSALVATGGMVSKSSPLEESELILVLHESEEVVDRHEADTAGGMTSLRLSALVATAGMVYLVSSLRSLSSSPSPDADSLQGF